MAARILDHPMKALRDAVSSYASAACAKERERETDLDGLAFHLADLAGDDWRTLTAERRAQLRVIAQFATAAAVETGRPRVS